MATPGRRAARPDRARGRPANAARVSSAATPPIPRTSTPRAHRCFTLGSQAIEQIDEQVEQDDQDPVDDHGAHDQGVVAVQGALDEVAADPGNAEDVSITTEPVTTGRSPGRDRRPPAGERPSRRGGLPRCARAGPWRAAYAQSRAALRSCCRGQARCRRSRSASAITGRTRLRGAPPFQPATGSQLSQTPKISVSSGAMTKFGTAIPVIAVAMTA